MIHYYNTLPPIFRNRLEDKNIAKLSVALQTCLEFEEQALRTGVPLTDTSKTADMTVVLQLMQDMNNRMISFEQRIPSMLNVNTATLLPPLNQQTMNHTLLTRPFCNFCEEYHDPKSCDVMKLSRERIFGKRLDRSINALDWVDDDDDIFAVTTRSQSQSQKNSDYNRNYVKNPPFNNAARNSFRDNNQTSTIADLNSKYNIVEDLAKVKASATLLDLARVPEQRKFLENYLASGVLSKTTSKYNGTSTSQNVEKPSGNNYVSDDDSPNDSNETLASVQSTYSPKNPPFYVSMKIMDKIAH